MKYKIIRKNAFNIVGFKEEFDKSSHPSTQWFTAEAIAELKRLNNTMPSGIISASPNLSGQRDLFQLIGVATTLPPQNGYASLSVEDGEWAVFKVPEQDSGTITRAWDAIVKNWLPTSGYRHTGGPELLQGFNGDSEVEIWIPVRR